jgi:hypothetical protein
VTATGPTASKTDNITGVPKRFYRIMVVPASATPPVINSIALNSGTVTLAWTSQAGATYRVQYLDSLNSTNWTDLSPDIVAAGSTANQTNIVGTLPRRFYRVMLVSP